MESACFNCGSLEHFYFECPFKDPVDRKFKILSKLVFKMKNPEVNNKSKQRQLERRKFYEEGKFIAYDLLLAGLEQLLDHLLKIKNQIAGNNITIFVFQKIKNLQLYEDSLAMLESYLPDIRQLTAHASGHIRYHVDMNFIERGILKGKEDHLRDLRDELVKEIKGALSCVEKFYQFMSNRNFAAVSNPRPENQIDLKQFVATISKISNNVIIVGAEDEGYCDSGTENNVLGYLV